MKLIAKSTEISAEYFSKHLERDFERIYKRRWIFDVFKLVKTQLL